VIPAEVRALAEDTTAHGPVPPGFERVLVDRYCFFAGPSDDMTMVQRLRLADDNVRSTIEEVRGLTRGRGRSWLTWWITDSSTPGGLESTLRGLGLEPAEMPVHEPEYAALALTTPPARSRTSLDVRRVQSFEEYLTAIEIGWDAFGQTDEQRETLRPALPLLYELQEQGVSSTYLAFLGGKPVAMANAVFADAGVMLLGGGVLPEARGRGCYQALVEARWDDAVERGTPALVVQAGAMSRPILERLGFQRIATLRVLVDRFE
jgi:GNAT superfamily N-acetyltransferase